MGRTITVIQIAVPFRKVSVSLIHFNVSDPELDHFLFSISLSSRFQNKSVERSHNSFLTVENGEKNLLGFMVVAIQGVSIKS